MSRFIYDRRAVRRSALSAGEAGLRIQRRSASGPPDMIGMAAVFYRAGDPGSEYELARGTGYRVVERIMPGAFDRAIREDEVVALRDHNPSLLLGRKSAGTLLLRSTPRGLEYQVSLPDSPTGRDVAEALRRGDLRGSSFSFIPDDVEFAEEAGGVEVVMVRSVRLFDVGPVAFPAYESTTAGLASGERSKPRPTGPRPPVHGSYVQKAMNRLSEIARTINV